MPETLTLPLLLSARMAHLAATEATIRLHRDAAYPQRLVMRLDGGYDCETVYPNHIRTMLDDLAAISREYVAGCASLAKADPLGIDEAVGHFRRTVELARDYTAAHTLTPNP
jgi:hypothetical protein